jgi:hypothetical protein
MLTILLYGDAGVGKSRLGGTSPAPRLILDAEGRAHYLPGNTVRWDAMRDKPPEADGNWDTCIVSVHNFDVLTQVYQWLQSGQHPFRSVVVDSLTEVQKRYIDKIVGAQQLEQQDWGAVLRNIESLVRNYRDLVMVPTNSLECVVFIAGEMEAEGKRRPRLQGGLRGGLPYMVDACGYLYITHDASNNVQRNMLVQPTQTIVAKDGTDRLGGPVIVSPDLTQMFDALVASPDTKESA